MASNFLSQSSILKRGLTIIRLMGTLPWILMFIQLRGMKYIKKQCKRNCAIFVVQQKLSIDQQLHKFLFLTSSQLEWIDLLSILSTCGIYKHLDPLSFKLQWSMKVLIFYHLNLLICQLLWFTYPSLWFEPLILLFFMIWWTPHVVTWILLFCQFPCDHLQNPLVCHLNHFVLLVAMWSSAKPLRLSFNPYVLLIAMWSFVENPKLSLDFVIATLNSWSNGSYPKRFVLFEFVTPLS
jgi:hypothetical protein